MGTLRISVLYFAGLRDSIGVADEALDLPEPVRTVGDLRRHLAARHRAYAEQQACVRIARNEAFAADGEVLCEGEVIALLPPVAGG
jgi:molybdopterin synthase sulfur carrier subunit